MLQLWLITLQSPWFQAQGPPPVFNDTAVAILTNWADTQVARSQDGHQCQPLVWRPNGQHGYGLWQLNCMPQEGHGAQEWHRFVLVNKLEYLFHCGHRHGQQAVSTSLPSTH